MAIYRSKKERGPIQRSLIIWLLILTIVPLLLTTGLMLQNRYRTSLKEVEGRLVAIRDLRVKQLNDWIGERQGDLSTLANDHHLRHLSPHLNDLAQTPENEEDLEFIQEHLQSYVNNYEDYLAIYVVNSSEGEVVMSSSPEMLHQSFLGSPAYNSAILMGEPSFVSDVVRESDHNQPVIHFSTPLYSSQDHTIKGVLVAVVIPDVQLWPMFKTGLGEYGQVYIVNNKGWAMSPLHDRNILLSSVLAMTDPVRESLDHKSGVLVAEDYRGIDVLSAYAPIPQADWVILVEMEMQAIQQPIWHSMQYTLAYIAILIVAVLALSFYFTSKITKPLHQLVNMANQMEQGDLKAWTEIRSYREINLLASTFNRLARRLDVSFRQQDVNSRIDRAIISSHNIMDYASSVSDLLMENTRSVMAAFYLYDERADAFVRKYSRGCNEELAETLQRKELGGVMMEALRTGNIAISEVRGEAVNFLYSTLIGAYVPEALVCIPVLVDDTTRAMLFMAALDSYRDEYVTLLEQVRYSMNMGLKTLLNESHIQMLLEDIREKHIELQAQTEELQAQTEELHAQTEELNAQSEELQIRNIELERERKRVQEANRLKSEFLSNMSHELRTPLNSIMALSQVLESQLSDKLSAEHNEYLEIIIRNGRDLLSLINDILDLSKIEAGRMNLDICDVSLRMMLDNICDSLTPQAHQKGVTLVRDYPKSMPVIRTDEKRLQQVFLNLMSNAVKFTIEGSVTVAAREDADGVWIRIEDTGVGIPQSDLPFIFDEFRQVDGSSKRRFEGTGLGLAIVRKTLDLLHGGVDVTSELDVGSVFTVHLPRSLHSDAPSFKAMRPPVNRHAPLILVVDDEPEACRMIEEALRRAGFHTISCTSSMEAVDMATELQPFAITLDIVMPDPDGLDVLRRLKENPETESIPVVMVSVSKETRAGLALGAVAVVSKPVDEKALLAEIRKLSKSSEAVVMVVEDDPLERARLAEAIRRAGFGVLEATNGEEALKKAHRVPPDLLVVDLLMPVMNGFELIDELHEREGLRDIPILVHSAKDLTPEEHSRLKGNVVKLLQKRGDSFKELLDYLTQTMRAIEHEAEAKIVTDPSRRKLLVVDDNEPVRIQLKQILEQAGYRVDTADSGSHALEILAGQAYDGVILDLMMPDVDGFETLSSMREIDHARHTPVLILTARDVSWDELSRLRADHISQLVQKGAIKKNELLSNIRQMLSSPYDVTGVTCESGKPCLLVVEDNPDNLVTVRAILGDRYEIIAAPTGEDGLEQARARSIDLVLLDISLPGMDGFEVLNEIRNDQSISALPVMALTAHAMKGDRQRMLNAGFNGYCMKPIDPQALYDEIEMLLSRK